MLPSRPHAPLLCAFLLLGCDPDAADTCDDAAGAGGKADAVSSARTAAVEQLVLGYWQSWQDADWKTYRDSFADEIHVDAGFAVFDDPDAFTELSRNGHPFRDVQMVDVFAHDDGATLVYEAIDDVTDQPVRVSELITTGEVGDTYGDPTLKILAITAVISTGPAPRDSQDRPRQSMEFQPFFPDQPDGPSFVLLWGDLQTSGSGFLLRVPAGFPGFHHTHRAGYHAVVLEGNVRNGPDVDDAPDLGPGSYWAQAAGEAHTTSCPSETDCLSLVMFDGPFDAAPVE